MAKIFKKKGYRCKNCKMVFSHILDFQVHRCPNTK